MRLFFSLVVFAIAVTASFGQSYSLQAKINNFNGSRAYLVQFKGDQQQITDSTSSLDGAFTFHFSTGMKPGVYRVLLGEKGSSNFFDEDPQFFDFIFNNENIVLESNYGDIPGTMNISESKENEVFYRFLKTNELSQTKLNRIAPLLMLYSPEDPFFHILHKEFLDVQNSLNSFSIALSDELPGSIASSVIMASLVPVIDTPGNSEEMRNFLKGHYFDMKSFNDARLLNSQIINKEILDYLALYRTPGLDQSQQEDQFILGIDKVMDAVGSEPKVYDYVLNFLVDGFQRFQMEKVLVHIAENYIEGGCETDSKKLLQKRLEGYEKMAPGKTVPDIINLDQNGKQVRLYNLKSNYTLVLFWASWCPHCSAFLNQLSKWYPEKDIDLEVYAVSIDSSRFAWEENILLGKYPWINTFSGAGWDGKAPKDYNVYATPTLFLLDSDHKIIAKPTTFKEFKKEAESLKSLKKPVERKDKQE